MAMALVGGCAACRPEPTGAAPLPPCLGVVFVADGAGDFRACSAHLRQAVEEAGCPLEVRTFVWSHGHRHNLSDQIDRRHAQDRGCCLAGAVAAELTEHPSRPVYLVGHSAGCAVVLAAAAQLPPGSVERMVLLAPSVRADGDLGPAARTSRSGIDVFCSRKDWVCRAVVPILEALLHLEWPAVSGCEGFPACDGVRHHWWHPGLKPFGHDGSHCGAYQPAHLRAFVLPLLTAPAGPASLPWNRRPHRRDQPGGSPCLCERRG
ncbi:MAG TPA: alpha/beta fold hydrolase [Gemmataceae bacterium]|nr:alpha/beta fold hydrolase [Gemmataceae bacterium]